jgi:hypothetical protein
MMEIVVIDTRQIQTYIFGSNRLRENIGASHLVKLATEDWIEKALFSQFPKEKVALSIEDEQCPAKIIYTGGGNAVLFFRENGQGKAFVQRYSRAVMECAPHLQLAAVAHPFTDLADLQTAVEDAFTELDRVKQNLPPSTPLMGLGVTVKCRSTGLAAMDMSPVIPGAEDGDQYPASAEILAKLDRVKDANDDLDRQFNPRPDSYQFPFDLDNLGRSADEQSFIAVVHIDGNDMGQRIKEHREKQKETAAFLAACRESSDEIGEVGKTALRETINTLVDAIEWVNGKPCIQHNNLVDNEITKIALKEVDRLDRKTGKKIGTGKYYLPFRPIVFGGDDITFVCDGRLGISLALTYMRALESATENFLDSGHPLTACAGVAIVKSHYPFARAYDLAEALCQQAKMYRRFLMLDRGVDDVSCLDWHFALSGLLGSLPEIRRREYCVAPGNLTLRPVTLAENIEEPLRAWPVIQKGIEAFQDTGNDLREANWSTKRNKVKALRDALRQGPDAVEHFRAAYRLEKLPEVTETGGAIPLSGWSDRNCVYFDALELADWHIPLKQEGFDEIAATR